MGEPSPFYQVGRQAGEAASGAFKRTQDLNTIDQILAESASSGDPRQVKASMDQILTQVSPERQEMALKLLQDRYNEIIGRQTAEELGVPFGASPQERAALIKSRGNLANQQQNKFKEGEDYQIIKERFGEKFANLWKTATDGGKTELLKTAVDASLRGENVSELLSNVKKPEDNINQIIPEEFPQMENGKLPKEANWPQFEKRPPGYTPKEWREEKKGWRKENIPLFSENKTKLNTAKRDQLGINSLQKINDSRKLPEGFARLLIDPKTGELYKSAQLLEGASPETQQWVKELARFSTRAKDAFGARVTNFDLMTFMKQFPSLLNTQEGRQRLLELMNINYQLDNEYRVALDKVYKKYGLGNIPQEKADELAQALIKDKTTELYDRYLEVAEGKFKKTELTNEGWSEGDVATDDETGETYIFQAGKWRKQ